MESLTFAESAALVGIPIEDDADGIVVQIRDRERIHKRLARMAQHDISKLNDTYLVAGGYVPNRVSKYQGRTKANLKRVYVIPLDCDLADYLGIEKDAVYAMPQAEIEALIPAMVNEAYFVAQMVHLPITVITYTGHGIQIITQLTGDNTDEIGRIDAALKSLVKRINAVSPRFVDPQAVDAGTRLFRAPGTLNTKCVPFGQPARIVRVLDTPGELLAVNELFEITGDDAKPKPSAPIPLNSKELPAGDAQLIVDTIAPHWQEGSRHALSLAVAGMLAKAGAPEHQAASIVAQLSAGDTEPWDRAKSVATSYQRYRTGGDVRGYFALREFVPIEAVDFVDGVLDRFRLSNAPRIVMKTGIESNKHSGDTVASMDVKPVPDICFDWPWIGEYVDMVAGCSEAPDQFHLAVGLSIAGATMGRNVCTRYVSKSIYGNLYHMLIGSAGTSRKDTAIRFGIELPRRLGGSQLKPHTPPFKLIHDMGSTQGLITELQGHSNLMLYVTEYMRLSQQGHRQNSTILTTLTNLWDTPWTIENVTAGTPMIAHLPYLSVLAAVQPGILANEMLEADIQSGYATRWLYVPGHGKEEGIPNPPEISSEKSHELYGRLLRLSLEYGSGGETQLELTQEAKDWWDDWYRRDRKHQAGSEDEESMQTRLALHTRKIAVVYAAVAGDQHLGIEHFERASAYVGWCWEHTAKLIKSWGVNVFNQIENRILMVLTQRGEMTRRTLYQQCSNRKWSSREFQQVLSSMIDNGLVALNPGGTIGIPED